MTRLIHCLCLALFATHAVLASVAPLGLGTVSGVSSITCPTGFATGSACYKATVACSGAANINVRFGVLQPSGAVSGTIVTHAGSGGTNTFDNGYVALYSAAGYRVIQTQWQSDWENTGSSFTKNIKTAACRPATLVYYLNQNYHPEQTGLGFCFHGHSGGSAVGAYLLSWYGAGAYIDQATISAGPVFGNIADGCKVPTVAPITICPTGQYGCTQTGFTQPQQYAGCNLATDASGVGAWTGYDCNCGSTTSDAANAAWLDMSVVSAGADYNFPQTSISQFICRPVTNNSGAQGQYWAAKMNSTNVPHFGQYLIDSCSGNEQIWTGSFQGTNGRTYSANDMTSKCVPRHA